MPNWCDNYLSVRGKEEDIKKFKKAVKNRHSDLSLNKLVPLPKELKATRSPALIVDERQYAEAVKKANEEYRKNPSLGLSLPITKKMSDELKRKYGFDNWYDWQVANWGTKWDVEAHLTAEGKTFLKYTFLSAWSPPVTWLEKVAKKYPGLKFFLKYEEPGMAFAGVAKGQGEIEDNSWNL